MRARVGFNGAIDGMAVFTTALTSDQIGQLATSIPEPSMLGLLITGLTGLLAYAWRKRR